MFSICGSGVVRKLAFSTVGEGAGELRALREEWPDTLRAWKTVDAVFCSLLLIPMMPGEALTAKLSGAVRQATASDDYRYKLLSFREQLSLRMLICITSQVARRAGKGTETQQTRPASGSPCHFVLEWSCMI